MSRASTHTPDHRGPDVVEEHRMPLLDHLRELRIRLIASVRALVVTTLASWFFADQIFGWLSAPMNDALHSTGTGSLAVTQATEGFMVQMKVAGLAGLMLASPVIFWQVWKFVAPGLYDTERRYVLPLVAASTCLFFGGGGFAYYGVFRVGFPLFLEMNGPDVTAVLSIDSYLTFATTLIVAFGLSFQLPVVVFFLARLGILNHVDMIRGFRYGVVLIAVVAAVLTPPDVVSMSLMGVPLLALYGLGIGVARVFSTKPVAVVEAP